MPTLFQPPPILHTRRLPVCPSTPKHACRAPPGTLSQPTLRRSTPITTTALPFSVRLDPEDVVSVRLVA